MNDILSEIKHLGLKVEPQQLNLFDELPLEVKDAYEEYRQAAAKLRAALETAFQNPPAPAPARQGAKSEVTQTGLPKPAVGVSYSAARPAGSSSSQPGDEGSTNARNGDANRQKNASKDSLEAVRHDSRMELVEIAEAVLLPALRNFCTPDSNLAIDLFDACRKQDFHCTAKEIAAVIQDRGPHKPAKASNGWWKTAVPRVFRAGNYQAIREHRREAERTQHSREEGSAQNRAQLEREQIAWATATLADPSAKETEQREARHVLEVFGAAETGRVA